MSSITHWQRILVQWVNCLELSEEPIKCITELPACTFLQELLRILTGGKFYSEVGISPEISKALASFLKEECPGFVGGAESCTLDDSEELTCILSLLLYYSTLDTKNIPLHFPLCAKLSNDVQMTIKTFLEVCISYNGNISRGGLKQAIESAVESGGQSTDVRSLLCSTPDVYSTTPKGRPTSPLKEYFQSPLTHQQKLIDQKNKEVRRLKQEIEAELVEKSDLLEEIAEKQALITDLQHKLKEKSEQLRNICEDSMKQRVDSSCSIEPGHKLSTEKVLQEEILSLEDYICKLEEEINIYQEDKNRLVDQLSKMEKKYISLESKAEVATCTVEKVQMELKEKEQLLTLYQEACEELQEHINELQAKQTQVPELDTSTQCMKGGGEDLGGAVVELKLQEKEEENAKLKCQLCSLSKENLSMKERLENLQQKAERLLTVEKELELASGVLADMESEKCELRDEVQRIAKILEMKGSEHEEMKEKEKLTTVELTTLREEFSKINSELAFQSQHTQKLEEEVKGFQEQARKSCNRIEFLEEEIVFVKKKMEAAEEELQGKNKILAEMKDEMLLLESNLSAERDKNMVYEAQISQLIMNNAALESYIEELKDDLKTTRDIESKLQSEKSELSSAAKELSEYMKDLQVHMNALKKQNSQCAVERSDLQNKVKLADEKILLLEAENSDYLQMFEELACVLKEKDSSSNKSCISETAELESGVVPLSNVKGDLECVKEEFLVSQKQKLELKESVATILHHQRQTLRSLLEEFLNSNDNLLSSVQASDTCDDVDKSKQILTKVCEEVKKKMAALQSELGSLSEDRGKMKEEMNVLKADIKKAKSEYENLKGKHDELILMRNQSVEGSEVQGKTCQTITQKRDGLLVVYKNKTELQDSLSKLSVEGLDSDDSCNREQQAEGQICSSNNEMLSNSKDNCQSTSIQLIASNGSKPEQHSAQKVPDEEGRFGFNVSVEFLHSFKELIGNSIKRLLTLLEKTSDANTSLSAEEKVFALLSEEAGSLLKDLNSRGQELVPFDCDAEKEITMMEAKNKWMYNSLNAELKYERASNENSDNLRSDRKEMKLFLEELAKIKSTLNNDMHTLHTKFCDVEAMLKSSCVVDAKFDDAVDIKTEQSKLKDAVTEIEEKYNALLPQLLCAIFGVLRWLEKSLILENVLCGSMDSSSLSELCFILVTNSQDVRCDVTIDKCENDEASDLLSIIGKNIADHKVLVDQQIEKLQSGIKNMIAEVNETVDKTQHLAFELVCATKSVSQPIVELASCMRENVLLDVKSDTVSDDGLVIANSLQGVKKLNSSLDSLERWDQVEKNRYMSNQAEVQVEACTLHHSRLVESNSNMMDTVVETCDVPSETDNEEQFDDSLEEKSRMQQCKLNISKSLKTTKENNVSKIEKPTSAGSVRRPPRATDSRGKSKWSLRSPTRTRTTKSTNEQADKVGRDRCERNIPEPNEVKLHRNFLDQIRTEFTIDDNHSVKSDSRTSLLSEQKDDAEYKKLVEGFSRQRNDIQALRKNSRVLQQNILSAENSRAKLEKKISELEGVNKQLRSEKTSVLVKQRVLESKYKQLEKELRGMSSSHKQQPAQSTELAHMKEYNVKLLEENMYLQEKIRETGMNKEHLKAIQKENENLKKQVTEYSVQCSLLLDELNSSKKKLSEVKKEYEVRYGMIKEKMKQAYIERIEKIKEERDDRDALRYACKDYLTKIAENQSRMSELSSKMWNLGEKLLLEKQERSWLESLLNEIKDRLQKDTDGQEMLRLLLERDCRQFDFDMIDVGMKSFSTHTIQQTRHYMFTTPREPRGNSVSEQFVYNKMRNVPKDFPSGMGKLFHTEDEPGEIFDNRCLADLKAGRCQVNKEWDKRRISVLQRRNTLCPPHLKSSYPAETQFNDPYAFTDDDLKAGSAVEDSLVAPREMLVDKLSDSSVSSVRSSKRKKDIGETLYSKPGPPTPGKNGRSQASELNITPRAPLREVNDGQRKTPNRLFGLFGGKRRSSDGARDEVSSLWNGMVTMLIVACLVSFMVAVYGHAYGWEEVYKFLQAEMDALPVPASLKSYLPK